VLHYRLNFLESMIFITNLFIVAGVVRHWNDHPNL
jgi:hypothetical protein